MSRDELWASLRPELRRAVAHMGADTVAERIPAGRATVYRLMRAERPPTLAILFGVRRVVESTAFKRSAQR